MNKDKHVLPGEVDTFSSRVRKNAEEQSNQQNRKTIYGPDNEPLATVDTDIGNGAFE